MTSKARERILTHAIAQLGHIRVWDVALAGEPLDPERPNDFWVMSQNVLAEAEALAQLAREYKNLHRTRLRPQVDSKETGSLKGEGENAPEMGH